MSETREQFRERVRQVYWTAWNGGMPFYDQHTTERAERSQRDGAEAVYAQALRDVIAELGDLSPANMVHQLDGYLRIFANELGIDLNEEDTP